jgi:hypothetical protein
MITPGTKGTATEALIRTALGKEVRTSMVRMRASWLYWVGPVTSDPRHFHDERQENPGQRIQYRCT